MSEATETATRGDLQAAITELRLELKLEIERARSEVVRWMFGQTLLLLGVITTLHFVR